MSGLVNALLLTPVDQQWYQASEAVLSADQALDTAVVSNSGVEAAQLGVAEADLHLLVAEWGAIPVAFAAGFVDDLSTLLNPGDLSTLLNPGDFAAMFDPAGMSSMLGTLAAELPTVLLSLIP